MFGKSNVTAYAKMQGAKGAAASIANTDAVDFNRDSTLVFPKGRQIQRGLNRFGRFPSKQSVAGRYGEGGYNMELRGSGTAGTPPNGLSPFLETLFGTKAVNAADTVDIGSGTTTGFDCAASLTVGQLVRVAIGAGFEIRIVDSKTGAGPYTYTVSKAFSLAPADGAEISAGVSFFHLGTEAANFFTLEQYIKSIRYLCVDAVCESMAVSISDEDVIKSTFALRTSSCTDTAATVDPYTPVYDDSPELVGLECNLILGSTATNMKQAEFSLKTRREIGGINSSGISDLPFANNFEATGKITPWMEDAAPFTAFFAGTVADIEITKGVAGNQLYILQQDVQYNGPEVSDDNGDFQWNLPYNITGGVWLGLF
ncbi:phage tail tube protein [Geopsychrobacter electrodiphilus]|uniref:phage tail tube protein n=1 Tax=Geopsychrobacter electrodiphilus TaxID=225196 RepID=UPI0003797CF5|nr:phage tail tube protein [Geopsychrobacter electrodiphilus]